MKRKLNNLQPNLYNNPFKNNLIFNKFKLSQKVNKIYMVKQVTHRKDNQIKIKFKVILNNKKYKKM
jgi:hypothetical protein